jgi:glycosyltransferase involved in cell wall biosynthesis
MKIAVWNRYWSTCGGGEKYAGLLAECLSRDHEVELLGVDPLREPDVEELARRLHLDWSRTSFRSLPPSHDIELTPHTEEYDLFVNASFRTSLVSEAKRSVLAVFFPHRVGPRWVARPFMVAGKAMQPILPRFGREIYRLAHRSTGMFLDSYHRILSISGYTTRWIKTRWKRESRIVAPPVDTEVFAPPPENEKRKVILSVGRFFARGHSKKHLEMIRVFRTMVDEGEIPAGWEYHLVGNVHRESRNDVRYFERVNELAKGYPVRVLAGASFDDLRREYHQASVFWHAAGWGESERWFPERFEHFGITTCEAMSAGCIPVVLARAGQLEVLEDGVSGYLFSNESEMRRKTRDVIDMFGRPESREMSRRAQRHVQKFSREQFQRNLYKGLAGLI